MNQIGKIPQSLPGRPKAALGRSSGGKYKGVSALKNADQVASALIALCLPAPGGASALTVQAWVKCARERLV